MSDTFNDLYGKLINEVFLERARQQLAAGVDGVACADAYADQGKPDFTLAHLLLTDNLSDEIKRDILARAYEQRATLSEEKAESFVSQYNRPFPLIKLEAQKDRHTAQQIRQGRRVRKSSKVMPLS